MWTYAVVIALSRVVLTAHFPSDVMVGAVVGVVGALLVRDWFAMRGLAFVLGADGTVRPCPGLRSHASKGLPGSERPHKKLAPDPRDASGYVAVTSGIS